MIADGKNELSVTANSRCGREEPQKKVRIVRLASGIRDIAERDTGRNWGGQTKVRRGKKKQ